jgi:hypothetical protein
MTLEHWASAATDATVGHIGGEARYVHDTTYPLFLRYRPLLWSLSDYVVSSITGGCIWLVPRRYEPGTSGQDRESYTVEI